MRRIEVNRPWIPPRDELYRMYDDILQSRQLTNNSKYVKRFEAALREHTRMPHVYTASNGTIALHLAIRALDMEPGEIITTPFSFIATSSSIVWEGFKPVFVEVEQETLCIDASLIEERINPNTRAIMAVHIFGNACNIETIHTISKRHGIPVIYDAAHAFGTMYQGRSIFGYGDISTVSMHASKIVTSVEGGAVFCSDENLAERIFKLRYFGKNASNTEEMIGINAKMDEFNAAFGILSLAHFNEEVARRAEISEAYDEAFKDMDHLYMLNPKYNDNRCYPYYPVLLPSESEVHRYMEKCKREDIIIRRYWHPALNTIDYIGADPSETPIAVNSANRIVCLPIYSDMTDDDVQRVISALSE